MIIKLHISGIQIMYSKECHSLLSILEKNNIPVDYQCRQGYCGFCRIKLLKGKVIYVHQILASIQQNDILLCCCKPNGDIELNI